MEKQSEQTAATAEAKTGAKGGRPKGALNRSTRAARESIGRFVDEASPHLREWLQQVAYGIPKVDQHGNLLRDKQGSVIWVVKPNPEAAIKAVADIAEYHLPKLSRSDVAVVAQVEQRAMAPFDPSIFTTEELNARLLASLGLINAGGQIIDITPAEAEPLPAWLQTGE